MAELPAPCGHTASLRADLEAILAIPDVRIAPHAAPDRWHIPMAVAGVTAVAMIASFVVLNGRKDEPVVATIGKVVAASAGARRAPVRTIVATRNVAPRLESDVVQAPAASLREDPVAARVAATAFAMRKGEADNRIAIAGRNRARPVDRRVPGAEASVGMAEQSAARRTVEPMGKGGTQVTEFAVASRVPTAPATAMLSAPVAAQQAAGSADLVADRAQRGPETAELRRRQALDLIRLLRRQ